MGGNYGKSQESKEPKLSALCPLPSALCSFRVDYTPPVVRVPVLKSDTPGRFEKSVVPPFPLVP
jgi:hypothetical protein